MSDSTATAVRVLMATYNGERFLRPQLDSVLNQEFRDFELLIRDDGSRDGTLGILDEYAARYSSITVIKGENLGAVGNFFRLLREPAPGISYFTFAGHDDVWHPTKLGRAVEQINTLPSAKPRAYCCRQRFIDANDQLLGESSGPVKPLSLANALVDNVVSGGTLLIDAPLRALVLEAQPPYSAIWEDWWIYLVASAFGNIVYDDRMLLDYRKHQTNSVATASGWPRLRQARKLLSRDARGMCAISRQAEAFERIYGSRLDIASQSLVRAFVRKPSSLAQRIHRALTLPVYRQRFIDGAFVRFLLLSGVL